MRNHFTAVHRKDDGSRQFRPPFGEQNPGNRPIFHCTFEMKIALFQSYENDVTLVFHLKHFDLQSVETSIPKDRKETRWFLRGKMTEIAAVVGVT